MNSRAALVNLAWAGSNAAGHVRYRAALRDPAGAQFRLLRTYLHDNADTEFGRTHCFSRLRTPADFRAAVPLHTFDDYAPYIDRIASGEPKVLTGQPVRRLVPSGGSTRAQKLIPYTAALQAEFNAAIGPWVCDLFRQDRALMAGPAYWSVSPAAQRSEGDNGSAVPVGFEDDSAYLGGVWGRLVGAAFAVPSAVRHVPDVETFRYVTLLCLLRAPELRLISVWHPSFLSLLLDDLAPRFADLVRDVAEGACSPHVPEFVRGALPMSPKPRRAAMLERAGSDDLRAIWPRLGLISCWADAHAALYLDALAARFPRVRLQPKGLIATEAFVSLPFAGWHPLAVRSHFFEFLDDAGDFRLAHELEQAGEYRVVVTTGGGLYRYQLNDRVRVDGFVGRTPSVRFVGKEDHVSDLFGEKLSEGFVGETLRQLFGRHRMAPRFAMLAPELTPAPAYVLFMEASAGAASSADTLAQDLDAALCANPHYRYCRDLGQLGAAQVCAVPSNAYAAYVAECRRRGQRIGDVKAMPLSRHTGWSSVFNSATGRASPASAEALHSLPPK